MDTKAVAFLTLAMVSLLPLTALAEVRSMDSNPALNAGLTEPQMKEFVSVIKARVGSKEADTAGKLLAELLAKRTEN